jgi:carboxyl-terminal processing protease
VSDEACVDLPFAVLVDEESYSAAEIFAAQLRESAGAIIVGEVTSGKGYTQRLYSLLNGGAAGVSISTYYTGGGVSLIGTGIIPDTVLSLTDEQEAMRAAGVLKSGDDPQLQEAVRLLGE